ncbi:L-histidine N(alpha)-methyltransferase [Streptomyces sp. NA02950]|uniref:L-histidine N(alpha)-methyltransferase n=1 Tax=Streptomyces sp. NA02950 TaxID=2742137 RepID=UPI00158FABFF|nr:L-histidine N(alpha)-methyltransferase [Streptomyces sp. NA02950]QKV91639.1 L-histidine N(alpha)-methyltransferase [Streptomyces sp. NA02950]
MSQDKQYFTNSELAYTYNVSPATVKNWVDGAQLGKLELTLTKRGNRSYVENTAFNIKLIKQLVEEGRKYRPKSTINNVKPRPEFYNLFTQGQQYDIVKKLELYHEIPREYNYLGEGAANWDKYAVRQSEEDAANMLTATVKLLEVNHQYLDELLANYERVNVVDIGVGNALPVKGLLEHLLDQGKLGRYIAMDISQEMLNIAERHIKEWFDGRVEFEGYEWDINYERFTNVIAEESLGANAHKTVNVVLFLGGTAGNFREPDNALRTINESLGRRDLFIETRKLDSATTRGYFDFNAKPNNSGLTSNHRLIFDLLNIKDDAYSVEMDFDEAARQRYIRVRLKSALNINFDFEDGGQYTVELKRDDTILLWRYWHQTGLEALQQLDRNNFHTLHASQTDDGDYLLTISQIKKG